MEGAVTKLTEGQAKMVLDLMNAPALMATNIIEQLETIVREHGDLPVLMHDDVAVREVCAYDADGNTHGPRTEIMFHGWR